MPEILELVRADDRCGLDTFESHYTYDVPDSTGSESFACPYCGGSDLAVVSV